MVIHNLRSPRQWEIISSRVDFEGKSVIDLGCGWGDLLRLARDVGASYCIGIDKEPQETGVFTVAADLDEWVNSPNIGIGATKATYDIALCFSVLPYLERPWQLLNWIYDHARVLFIECQYAGDGPGFDWLVDDNRMQEWLENYWPNVKPIGHTVVKDRNKKRTIWMCE